MTVRLTARAISDLTDARDHYESIDDALAERFLDQVDIAVERLLAFPHGAPPVEGFPDVRRARLRRFPYGVFYRVDEAGILILRVLHTRRDRGDVD